MGRDLAGRARLDAREMGRGGVRRLIGHVAAVTLALDTMRFVLVWPLRWFVWLLYFVEVSNRLRRHPQFDPSGPHPRKNSKHCSIQAGQHGQAPADGLRSPREPEIPLACQGVRPAVAWKTLVTANIVDMSTKWSCGKTSVRRIVRHALVPR